MHDRLHGNLHCTEHSRHRSIRSAMLVTWTLFCDHQPCSERVSATAGSNELACTLVQQNAAHEGWCVARDRLVDRGDYCPGHGRRR